jgi:hypothetical protein
MTHLAWFCNCFSSPFSCLLVLHVMSFKEAFVFQAQWQHVPQAQLRLHTVTKSGFSPGTGFQYRDIPVVKAHFGLTAIAAQHAEGDSRLK